MYLQQILFMFTSKSCFDVIAFQFMDDQNNLNIYWTTFATFQPNENFLFMFKYKMQQDETQRWRERHIQ